MTNCLHCGKPLSPRPEGRPGPKPRFCDAKCRASAWRGMAPVVSEVIEGPWPLACLVCGCQTVVIERTIYNRRITVSRFTCECGYEDSLERPFDPDDLEPFPRPVLVLEIPVNDVDYWQARALQLEAKLNTILAALITE